jgi:hypothetical protein
VKKNNKQRLGDQRKFCENRVGNAWGFLQLFPNYIGVYAKANLITREIEEQDYQFPFIIHY